jgi:hypothetical protein
MPNAGTLSKEDAEALLLLLETPSDFTIKVKLDTQEVVVVNKHAAAPAEPFLVMTVRIAQAMIADSDGMAPAIDHAKKQFQHALDLWQTCSDEEEDVMPLPKGKELSIQDMNTLKTRKLSVATKLYQPVLGSSPNSRYFVVGVNQKFKVAARIKDHAVSIRVEGPGLQSAETRSYMESLGFENLQSGSYGSVHVNCQGVGQPAKMIGSVLLALSNEWKTGLPDIEKLESAHGA